MQYWNNGLPFLGGNAGTEPGQTLYWHDGAPIIQVYESTISSHMWKKCAGIASADVKSVAAVLISDIQTLLNI